MRIQNGFLLRAVGRDQRPADVLAPVLSGAARVPEVRDGQLAWRLHAPPDRDLAIRIVLAWDALAKASPGRWCSMTTCGNRMKARRHYQRAAGH